MCGGCALGAASTTVPGVPAAKLALASSAGIDLSGARRRLSSRNCSVTGSLLVPGGPVRGTSKRISTMLLPLSSVPPARATACGTRKRPKMPLDEVKLSVPTRLPFTTTCTSRSGLELSVLAQLANVSRKSSSGSGITMRMMP